MEPNICMNHIAALYKAAGKVVSIAVCSSETFFQGKTRFTLLRSSSFILLFLCSLLCRIMTNFLYLRILLLLCSYCAHFSLLEPKLARGKSVATTGICARYVFEGNFFFWNILSMIQCGCVGGGVGGLGVIS